MTPDSVLSLGHHALEITILLVLVLLVPALLVGLLVSMFQAATQINEMTLSFIPKLIVTFLTVMLAGPWLLEIVRDYTVTLFIEIPAMVY